VIALLRGEVALRRADHVVIVCQGVGYRVAVSAQTLRHVPAAGEHATLHTHLIAREDALTLYGFHAEQERDLFLMLLGVQAIGPKVALAVLSSGSPRDLIGALAAGDAARFQAVPGIGKRTAERIIVELREKVAGALEQESAVASAEVSDARGLARDGLVNLGYAQLEAEQLLDGLESDDAEELIAAALRRAAAARSQA
jgi:Holliday junction DNA helicase RuvA